MKKKLFKGNLPEKPITNGENDIGDRLRYFRKFKGMNGTQLAARIDISQGSLCDLENGNSLPSATTLQNLYYAGCDINWLLTGEDQ